MLLSTLLALLVAAPPTYERPDVLVWNIENGGVKAKVPGFVTDAVARRVSKNPHVRVISSDDIRRLAGLEAEKALMGAPAEDRMKAIAEAVDAELVVFGAARFVGGEIQAELQLFEPDKARALHRVKAKGNNFKTLEADIARAADALVDKALEPPAANLEVAVARLASGFGRGEVRPLLYGDTPFSSKLGARIAAAVGAKLKAGPPIAGSFVENADVIEIALEGGGQRAQTRVIRAALEARSIKPENLDVVVAEQQMLSAQRQGDIELEAWTEKGSVGVVFAEDDEFHLFVKVNKPAWVRVVYHLADGQRALLEQAWKVEKTGTPVQHPDTFAAAPPFGVERVQFIAFAQAPPPLRTSGETIEGTRYQLIKSLDDIVKYRGFKRVKAAGYAEALITLTTTWK